MFLLTTLLALSQLNFASCHTDFKDEKAPSSYLENSSKLDPKVIKSRFILNSDPSITKVADVPLHPAWWSRPHEYAWAAEFAGPDFVVLDAACGISHPFKWLLGETCKETWACDADPRIENIDQLIREVFDDLGKEAYEVVLAKEAWKNVKLVRSSICDLSPSMPKFDRIFCISTLEHLSINDMQSALNAFSQFLAPDGLVILTVDYPAVTPEILFQLADHAGLEPAGSVEMGIPSLNSLKNPAWHIYRCILKHTKQVNENG